MSRNKFYAEELRRYSFICPIIRPMNLLESRNRVVLSVGLLLSATALGQAVKGSDVLQGLGASEQDIQDLESGGVLVYDSKPYENTPRDLAADAAVLINSELADVVEHLEANVSFVPNDEMLAHAEILSDADFAGVEFTVEDYEEVESLISAKRGKDFNFSDDEYAYITKELGGLKKSDQATQLAAASDVMRQILLDRYHAYRDGGLVGIAPYSRSSRKKVSAGDELRMTSETFAPFEKDFPGYYRVLIDYPDADNSCCKHEFRWLKTKIRGRATFALAHTVYQLTNEFLITTERFFYITSQANSLQITLAWLPYDHDTYMGLSMSANADILDSLLGKMLRPLGRNKAKEFVEEALMQVRSELDESAESVEQ